MEETKDYPQLLSRLWNHVQSNEESQKEKIKILEECDNLLSDPIINENPFFSSKTRLIQYKAGKNHDLKSIITDLEASTKLDPTNPDILICLSEAHLHNGNTEEAIASLEFACQFGEFPEVYNLMSLCYRRKKTVDYDKSLELAKKSLKIDMKNGKSWANLGMSYLAQSGRENLLQSAKALRMAIKNGENRNADVIMNLGTVTELLLDFPEALKLYEEAMIITEGWSLPAANLGRLKQMSLKAINRAHELVSISPKRKNEILKRLKTENDFLVMEIPSDKSDPSQLVICFTQTGETRLFAVTQTLRAYLRYEKTIIRVPNTNFRLLVVDEKSIPFHIIENQNEIEIIGGAKPSEVAPVTVSSSLA